VSLILAIDPATSTGVSIIDPSSLDILEVYTLRSNPKDLWGARCVDILAQFREVCGSYCKDIKIIAYEKNTATSLIVKAIPLLFAAEIPHALMNDSTGIVPSEWKAYVSRRVDTSHFPVKGCDALDALIPGICEDMQISEDGADSVLIGLAFVDKLKRKLKERKSKGETKTWEGFSRMMELDAVREKPKSRR
jgi:hypothetical protein